jgi:hypothetical protein
VARTPLVDEVLDGLWHAARIFSPRALDKIGLFL